MVRFGIPGIYFIFPAFSRSGIGALAFCDITLQVIRQIIRAQHLPFFLCLQAAECEEFIFPVEMDSGRCCCYCLVILASQGNRYQVFTGWQFVKRLILFICPGHPVIDNDVASVCCCIGYRIIDVVSFQ